MSSQKPDDSVYLSLDQGGHSSRVFAFDRQGRLLARAQQTVREQRPKPLWVEQDPAELVTSIRRCVDHIANDPLLAGRPLATAGLATQRASVCCWNRRTGDALTPVISWQDRRAHTWLEQFRPQAALIQQHTGLTLSAHYGVSKLRWCLDNVAAVQAALARDELCFGPLASFLLFSLLDEKPFQVDPANASRTLLWNLHRNDWDPELLDLFQIPTQALPQICDTLTDYGTLTVGQQSVPVQLCTGDQSAALYAHGAPQAQTAYVNIGTGAFVSTPCAAPPPDTAGLLCSLVFKTGDRRDYVLEGTVNGAGSALDLQANQVNLSIETVYAKLNTWLQAEASPPLFLNGISGLGAPFWVPEFYSRFIGEGDAAAKMVAVAESVVFLMVIILQRMTRFSAIQTLQISGGMSRLDNLCQRLADLSGYAVIRTPECEATSQGVAWLLAGNPKNWLSTTQRTVFMPRENQGLVARFTCWHAELLAALGHQQRQADSGTST